jgi:hypothetical protein
MIALLLSFCMLHPGFAAADAGSSALKRQIFAQPEYNFSFDAKEAETLLRTPLNTEVAIPLPGGEVLMATYLGPLTDGSGKKTVIFKTEGVLTEREYEMEFVRHGAPEKIGQAAPRVSSPGETPASSPSPAAPGNGTGEKPGFGSSLGAAAGAGATAAAVTGIAKGLIVTPGDEREMARLEKEYQEAAGRAATQQNLLLKELNDYEQAITSEMGPALEALKAYEPLAPQSLRAPSTDFMQSPLGAKVESVRRSMANFKSSDPVRNDLRALSLRSADAAETSFGQGAMQDAAALGELAETAAEVALGLVPLTSLLQDGYGLFTGKSIVSGRELSSFERSLAGVGFAAGLVTGGLASSFVDGVRIGSKILAEAGGPTKLVLKGFEDFSHYAKGLGISTADGMRDLVRFTRETLGNEIGAIGNITELKARKQIGRWADDFDISRIHATNDLNAAVLAKNPKYKPPYLPNSTAADVITRARTPGYVRLSGPGSKPAGTYIVRKEAVDRSLTPLQLKEKYSLPWVPDGINDVTLRAHTLLRRSKIKANFGGGERAIQYEILTPLEWNPAEFGEVVPLEKYLRELP